MVNGTVRDLSFLSAPLTFTARLLQLPTSHPQARAPHVGRSKARANGFFSSVSFPCIREELFPKNPFRQAVQFVHTNTLMGWAPCMLVKYSEYQLCPKKTLHFIAETCLSLAAKIGWENKLACQFLQQRRDKRERCQEGLPQNSMMMCCVKLSIINKHYDTLSLKSPQTERQRTIKVGSTEFINIYTVHFSYLFYQKQLFSVSALKK